MSARALRIGLYGGTFDPVHVAHLALARWARDELALDEVIWMPAGHPWQKHRPATPAADREAMVRLAIAGEPGFVLSTLESRRAGPSYTLDTVRELSAQRPEAEWHLLIGEDQYACFHTWHGWRELLQRVTLAVAQRGGPAGHPGCVVADAVRAVPHEIVPLPAIDLSSTEIRARVARGASIAGMVPAAVASYIERHHLYRTVPAAAAAVPPPPPGAEWTSANCSARSSMDWKI